MAEDELYEDDESIEEVRTAWNAGEKGTTSGPRDLNRRAKSIVDRAVARFEVRQTVQLRVVASATTATTKEVPAGGALPSSVAPVEDEPVTAVAYQVV